MKRKEILQQSEIKADRIAHKATRVQQHRAKLKAIKEKEREEKRQAKLE